ncbi:MAG: DUF4830 domain-containing protein [Clostridia bacterium]|nr:DUF4830 domain-containing protein [Clostridia bacterium]
MFVYTMKASGLKFFAVIAVSVAILATVIGVLPAVSAASDVASVTTDFKNVATEEDMVNFLSGFGYEAEAKATQTYEIDIPEEFNSVLEKYNNIQRAQGLNLKRYSGKDATAYVFKITNYDYEGEVFATLFIRNNRVIAADICSKDGEGFVHGLRKQ